MLTTVLNKSNHLEEYSLQIKHKSDKLVNYFLICYFFIGLVLANFYDTWLIAWGIGCLSLFAYYSSKLLLPTSDLYQYVLSAVLGIFMAQYIFEMHGMFEMHFTAFIGSAILVTYQNWKLQLPILIVVILHHALFGYLQFIGVGSIYFTQLDYMDLQTFIIHITLSGIIFLLCGLWAYHFKKYSEKYIEMNFELGRLEESESKKEELLKANKELDRFVYSTSHDLRSPLTSVLGLVSFIEDETKEPETLTHAQMIRSRIKRLDDFVINILNYSRNSRLEIVPVPVNLNKVVRQVVEDLGHMPQSSKMEFKINIDEGIPFCSDIQRVTTVMENLIGNAIKYYSPIQQKPFVSIEAKINPNEAVITVEDNGIGIAEEHQSKIFDMFYRISGSTSGSGLGLYLVKEIIDKLNGKISLHSRLYVGTKYTITLNNTKNGDKY